MKKNVVTIILILAILLIGFIFTFVNSQEITYRDPNKYNQAIKLIKQTEKINHFPTKIPANAKNIQFYCFTSLYKGELLLLKFDIDKNFILNEMKNNKFLNSNTQIGTSQNIYYMYSDNGRIKIDGLTWYVIDDKDNRKYFKKFFPYFTGIGVNKNLSQIMYYYIQPGD